MTSIPNNNLVNEFAVLNKKFLRLALFHCICFLMSGYAMLTLIWRSVSCDTSSSSQTSPIICRDPGRGSWFSNLACAGSVSWWATIMAGIQDISNITYLLHPSFFRDLRRKKFTFCFKSQMVLEYYSIVNLIRIL